MKDCSPDPAVKVKSFKERDSASYGPWAEIYDCHINRLGVTACPSFCALVKLRKGDRVTREAARCVVLVVDLSSGMIATANHHKTPGAEYRVMDAESLEPRDVSLGAYTEFGKRSFAGQGRSV
jgi:hypothetical protein